MNSLRLVPAALLALAGALAPAARADDPSRPDVPGAAPAWPAGDLAAQPLTLPAGLLRVEVPVTVNLSSGLAGEPIAVPAAISYGIAPHYTAGIVHARGLCLTGEDGGCASVYDDVGAQVRLLLWDGGSTELASEATLLASRLDDLALDGQLGFLLRHAAGPLALVARVDLASALTDRSRRLYTEALSGTLEARARLAARLSGYAQLGAAKALGVISPFEIPTAVPVAAGLVGSPAPRLELGAELRFPNLLGSAGGSDEREATAVVRLFL